MGAEDDAPNMDELTRRAEALERENRELRESLGSIASDRRSGTPPQQPRATRPQEMTPAPPKTVRTLLPGPRDEQAYARPFAGVSSSYAVGWLLACAAAAYGSYVAFLVTVGPHSDGTG